MINKIKKKLSLPQLSGIIAASLDLAFWIWFLVYNSVHIRSGMLEEGFLGMMIIHMPSSLLLPIFGNIILFPFLTNDSILPQTIFLFIVGVSQYFVIGYLLGKLIVYIKRTLKKRKTKRVNIASP